MEKITIEELLSEDFNKDIVLLNDENKEEKFSLIATIPFNNDVYTILTKKDANDDVAYVFKVIPCENDVDFSYIDDIDIINEIFNIYNEIG